MSDPDRLDTFTERARKVLDLAQEEAQQLNHNYVGTEHLLLGLVREGQGMGVLVLKHLGVNLDEVRSAVEAQLGGGDQAGVEEIGWTPLTKKVIELAADESRRLNHHFVGAEHLLMGLVRTGEGVAASVLENLGVNLEKVRIQAIRVASQRTDPP